MEHLNVYHVEWPQGGGYGTFDSMVVIAYCQIEARHMHPWDDKYDNNWDSTVWAFSPEDVEVTWLGPAKVGETRRIVCASYNAG